MLVEVHPFFPQNKIINSNFPCIQVQDFVCKGIKAQANISLPEHCPAPCIASTWDETPCRNLTKIIINSLMTQLAVICKED